VSTSSWPAERRHVSLDFEEEFDTEPRERDPKQEKAEDEIVAYLEKNRGTVFFSRQLEVHFEKNWFHWITNRVLRDLVSRRLLKSEVRPLKTGGSVTLLWHRSHRYYRRDAVEVVKLVETYADPNIGAALGLQGEVMLLEGLAKRQFLLTGRDTRTHRGKTWPGH
jgi:hypothetical protein